MSTAASPVELRSHVGGAWVEGAGGTLLDHEPARPAELVASGRLLDAAEVDAAVVAAAAAASAWRATSIHARAAVLDRTADVLTGRLEALAVELTREQGKTLAESRAEVGRAIRLLRYNAALADASDGDGYASPRTGERIFTVRVPLGPTAIVTPWNVPIAIPVWKIAPALLYGNTVVWKPARLVPLLALRLMEAFAEAGLPAGVCNLVFANAAAGDALLAHPEIRACSFTGSTDVGRHLIARGAEHGVRVQAEMGGKNAAIVLADADFDHAVEQVASGAMLSTGQRCTATSRVLVERPLFERFAEALAARSARFRVGDPLDPSTEIGPLVSEERRRAVLDAYATARAQGATVLVGGGQLDVDGDGGHYVEPTVVVDVKPDDTVFVDEIFGPLAAVVPFDDLEEAFALANRGRYGLSGAIFTRDLGRAMGAVDAFDVGVLHVNSETCGADPHVPFGGVKDSGSFMREMGTAARDFYTESRTVYLRVPDAAPSSFAIASNRGG
ncbi:MAG TPA: aldehyde dehydrogenase family protein [Conexibacter sp.]|nr:aldehyde dehydrogenase family protein [Conexibacter sp.]